MLERPFVIRKCGLPTLRRLQTGLREGPAGPGRPEGPAVVPADGPPVHARAGAEVDEVHPRGRAHRQKASY